MRHSYKLNLVNQLIGENDKDDTHTQRQDRATLRAGMHTSDDICHPHHSYTNRHRSNETLVQTFGGNINSYRWLDLLA